MSDLSPDSLNAWRIYAIKRRLDQLAAERESDLCDTIAGVQQARQRAVNDITGICQKSWSPPIDALTSELIDTAIAKHVAEKRKP